MTLRNYPLHTILTGIRASGKICKDFEVGLRSLGGQVFAECVDMEGGERLRVKG
jgi:hypothetical protein